MYLSSNWLKNFIPDLDVSDSEAFKYRVDTRLSEVESIIETGAELKGLVIANVVSIAPHPKHKNLTVCQVDIGTKQHLQIVCGADNVKEGMRSVAVVPGGSVYGPEGEPMQIAEREVAGVTSQGMLCAPDELGLNDDHRGIIEIDNSTPIGTDVTELFSDTVIEIENKALPHRPDTFSHLGIARELSAIWGLDLSIPHGEIPPSHANNQVDIEIDNQIPKLVPRYSGLALTEVRVKPSPLWLQIALARAGERSVNNIVDITNYVMHHTGQPLHAFDLDKLSSQKVIIRKSKKGEQIRTLDQQHRKLTEGTIVIADISGPIAIGGIMGGESTAVDDSTTRIFLEAASFEMYTIRRTSRELGLRSEAQY